MKTKLFFLSVFALVMLSCNSRTGDYQSLQAERDSLAREKEAMKVEMESYFATINLIEQNIEKIKNAEKLITLLPYGEETDVDSRNKINDDLAFINEMLRANREEINALKEKLSKSNYKFAELERTVTRLTKALEEEAAKVKALQIQLAQKDSLISQLSVDIEDLSVNIEVLESEKETHITKIKEQDETIHTAWYVFGTRRELREQNIVTSDGWLRPNRVLESDFNKNYFVRIDARRTKSIPLYSTRAKILSTHPRTSYTLEKQNDTFTLLITDTQEFWSVSKYLVIEVD
jgi:predicted  nucleic acid-binding Zn-ribbon protein